MQHSIALSSAAGATLHHRGITGRGVGIAVIDSGVTAPEAFGDRLLIGPDFTRDAGTDDMGRDHTGHGTHLAGLAAADRVGTAPGARVISLKAAGPGGETQVPAVIAAIDWAVANRRRLSLDVILLAFGAEQLGGSDPLADAVARAWRAGMVVVTSAGNSGDAALPTPAHIDEVITVGAAERTDDAWARCEFTNAGTPGQRLDLLAPGRSLVSLLAPGSAAEDAPAESRVADGFVKGSGSSQAAAVVAGAAALLLEADPSLTPDEVKSILTTSAARIDDEAAGAGALDLDVAFACLASGLFRAETPSSHPAATAAKWSGLEWSGWSWTGWSWTGWSWTGWSWTGLEWSGWSWTGLEWSGWSWTGLEWSGWSWTGWSWTGLEWSGWSWTGWSWTGLEWSGWSWTGLEWSGWSWTGWSWTGLEWA